MFGLNDPFGLNNHMNSMFNGFMFDPFGQQQQNQRQQQNRQPNGSNNGNNRSNNQLAMRNSFDPFGHMSNSMISPFDHHSSIMAHHQQAMQNPFALMNQMMSGNMFNNHFEDQLSNIINADPSSQVFSSSSVISYSNTGDGKPKIYQASSQTTQAPGGIKETRQMVRDSEKGLEKVAVGHHIGERAHIIERQKLKGGPVEEIVNLENLDDNEVNEFNQEFENKIRSSYHPHNSHHHHRPHIGSQNQPFAIEDGRSSRKDKDRKSKSKSKH